MCRPTDHHILLIAGTTRPANCIFIYNWTPDIYNWAPAWRRKFFSDWRQDSTDKIYSKCNLCQAKQSYLTGNLSSYTNFTKHLKGVLAEWNAYDEDQSKKKGDPTKQSIKAYGTGKSIHTSRQQQLDIQLTYSMAEVKIPLNILRRP